MAFTGRELYLDLGVAPFTRSPGDREVIRESPLPLFPVLPSR